MSSFRFRLQTLMQMRSAERDRRRAELAQALRAAELLNEQRNELVREQQATLEAARRMAGPGEANVDALIRTHRHGLLLKSDLSQLVGQQELVEQEIQRRRQALVEADRQVRVLEKLHERKLEEFQQEELRQEVRILDESGNNAAARRQRDDAA